MKLTQSQVRMLQSVRARTQWARYAWEECRDTCRGRTFFALAKRGLIHNGLQEYYLTDAGEQALKDNQKEPKARKALPKAGKRTNEWNEIRTKELKPAFKRAGVVECELRWPGCMKDNYLGFAHSKRRRDITTPEQMREVLICCQNCHDALDLRPHAETEAIVQTIIAARRVPVVLPVLPTK